ncbi:MAG: PBP1A family penicillin-binding protein [Bradyrhizobiaceae bacterium]|nr:PBP1A family penicillin-binding protein [Bradyrhizobiaceae bacterium]
MDRFYVAGIKRLAVEAVSEGFTLGCVGAVFMLALAVPAFHETSDEDWIKKQELAVTFLDRYGNKLGERGIRHNDTVPLEEFPDHLIKAVLATEDRRFYEHFGIDLAGTARALTTNIQAQGVVQGGSSITQQLAKNLFLSNERTIERKVKEAFLAIWLETRLTKREILKLYLDRAYLGGGAFGVDGAAVYYFGKSARDVNLAEAAMLAGLFKAPARFAPHINLAAARARASTVLDNLIEAGFMTEGQVFGARRNPARAIDRRNEEVPNYYLDWAYREVADIIDRRMAGKVSERVFVVRTGLDPAIQHGAEEAVESSLRQFGKDYGASQAAMVIMDPGGLVRAMVGGRDYGESQFNRAVDAQRQPGSSFKPYVYATALLAGMKPTDIILDAPYCNGNWCPKNYSGGYAGPVSMMTALTRSLNIPAVRTADKVGRKNIAETMRKLGVKSDIPISAPMPLGAVDLTVLEHTQSYAHFANGGMKADAHAAIEIRTPLGEVVWRHDRDEPKPERILPLRVVEDMNQMLHNVVENGTGRRARIDGFFVSGKTGTTNAYRDAWFMGYTGNYVAGIWIGNDDYSPTRRMTGGSLPAMTWQRAMAYAHQGVESLPVAGLGGQPPRTGIPLAAAGTDQQTVHRPTTLSGRSVQQLLRIEKIMREASPPSPLPPSAAAQPDRRAATSDASAQNVSGN